MAKGFHKRKSFYALFIYRFLGFPLVFKLFTKIVNFLISRKPNLNMEELIKKEKPDLLIHPSVLEGIYIDDVIFYGNKFKKPYISVL